MRVEHAKAEHIVSLLTQSTHSCISPGSLEKIKKAEEAPHSYSVFVDDNLVLCAGIAEYWEGRGEAWAVVSESSRKNFIQVHNAVRRFLDVCPVTRVEAAVEYDFEAGHRWVKALGFILETPRAVKYLPDGKDASLYSRVRH